MYSEPNQQLYIHFKLAIAEAVAHSRQGYSIHTLPVERKNLAEKIQKILNNTTRSSIMWTRLTHLLNEYAWHKYHFGVLSELLKRVNHALKKFPIHTLMQKDILELESINQQLELRCETLAESNHALQQDVERSHDPELAERYRKLLSDNEMLKFSNHRLIEQNESLLERMTELEHYNAQLEQRIKALATVNATLQQAHEQLQIAHERVCERLIKSEHCQETILAELKAIKQQQGNQQNEIKALTEQVTHKDQHIAALTRKIAGAVKNANPQALATSDTLPRNQAPSNAALPTNSVESEPIPVYRSSATTLGGEIHQPRW